MRGVYLTGMGIRYCVLIKAQAQMRTFTLTKCNKVPFCMTFWNDCSGHGLFIYIYSFFATPVELLKFARPVAR